MALFKGLRLKLNCLIKYDLQYSSRLCSSSLSHSIVGEKMINSSAYIKKKFFNIASSVVV